MGIINGLIEHIDIFTCSNDIFTDIINAAKNNDAFFCRKLKDDQKITYKDEEITILLEKNYDSIITETNIYQVNTYGNDKISHIVKLDQISETGIAINMNMDEDHPIYLNGTVIHELASQNVISKQKLDIQLLHQRITKYINKHSTMNKVDLFNLPTINLLNIILLDDYLDYKCSYDIALTNLGLSVLDILLAFVPLMFLFDSRNNTLRFFMLPMPIITTIVLKIYQEVLKNNNNEARNNICINFSDYSKYYKLVLLDYSYSPVLNSDYGELFRCIFSYIIDDNFCSLQIARYLFELINLNCTNAIVNSKNDFESFISIIAKDIHSMDYSNLSKIKLKLNLINFISVFIYNYLYYNAEPTDIATLHTINHFSSVGFLCYNYFRNIYTNINTGTLKIISVATFEEKFQEELKTWKQDLKDLSVEMFSEMKNSYLGKNELFKKFCLLIPTIYPLYYIINCGNMTSKLITNDAEIVFYELLMQLYATCAYYPNELLNSKAALVYNSNENAEQAYAIDANSKQKYIVFYDTYNISIDIKKRLKFLFRIGQVYSKSILYMHVMIDDFNNSQPSAVLNKYCFYNNGTYTNQNINIYKVDFLN